VKHPTCNTPMNHTDHIELHKRAALIGALERLKQIEKLLPSIKRCIEQGGFPIYLADMLDLVQMMASDQARFHAVANVGAEIARDEEYARRAKKRAKR
jgi:hypothetical protein